ncbi:MAG: hypothetical protein MMC23_004529 [Stictis urceolatum]|nr:hypothetical protein [Stictis urceolata]
MPATVENVTAGVKARVKRAMSEPLISLDSQQQQSAMNDSSWADGLRGIASIYVVASHIVLCIARRLVLPCCGHEGTSTPALFQRPIFRLVAQGHSWVALFFILMGFVNALKPIKLSRTKQTETALSSLAVSCFRRTFRLILPATAATLISWTVCQLGMYETARNGDAYWLYTYTPMMSQSWGTAIDDLFYGLRMTWSYNDINAYDQPQWALVYLLTGSMFVFCAMLMTINLTPGWRAFAFCGFGIWSLDWSMKTGDPLVGLTVFFGVALSELSLSDFVHRLSKASPIVTPPLALIALVLMSYPGDYSQDAPWSAVMQDFARNRFHPALQGDLARSYGSIGGILLVFSIIISPHARRLLSRKPLLWLGKLSFPIYLLHGTFLRTVFAWILFQSTPKAYQVTGADGNQYSIERYPQGSDFRAFVAVGVSMTLCLVACHFWAKKIEPKFGHITKWAEDTMTGNRAGQVAVNGRPVLPLRKE